MTEMALQPHVSSGPLDLLPPAEPRRQWSCIFLNFLWLMSYFRHSGSMRSQATDLIIQAWGQPGC